MEHARLWDCVYKLSEKEPGFIIQDGYRAWNPSGHYTFFQFNIGDFSYKVSNNMYYVFAVNRLPFELPPIFFINLLRLKMYYLIVSHGLLNNKEGSYYCRKEIGSCLFQLQDFLTDNGHPWKTLWDYDLVPFSRATAGRYKVIASS